MLSSERRTKEAFKTALAMVLAYGTALSWDWMNPYWAGFAVAMISLPTTGQSLEKGAMRLLGTLVGSIAALTLIDLYPQDRWLFLACVSVYVGFCTYMMNSGRYQYFWFVSAFVALVICVHSGPIAESAFNTAINRTLETGLGIFIYTMVSVFLWPQSSAVPLEETARNLLRSQRQLYQAHRKAEGGGEDQSEIPQMLTQEIQLLARLAQLLNAAASESYEVRERRDDWLRLHHESAALLQALDFWRESFPEIRHLELVSLIPDLEAIHRSIEETFDEIEIAWTGTSSAYDPLEIQVEIDRSEVLRLSHLERAALALTKTNLEGIAYHSKKLLESVRAMKGLAESVHKQNPSETAPRVSPIDPDRLGAVVRVVAILWIAFLIWVYLDPPGHASFAQLSATLALGLVMMPQARPSMLFMPFLLGSAFGGVIYLLVMPSLSGYLELAAVLFAAIFTINFLFHEPRQGISRLVGMITLLVLTSIENQQSYSFSGFANSTAMMLLVVAFLTAVSYVPNSPRSEKVFLRLFSQFLHCVAYLLDRPEQTGWRQGWIGGEWKSDYCRSSLVNLPARLGQISRGIDFRILSPTSRDQVDGLLASIQTLKIRIHAVEEAHREGHSDRLSTGLRDDMAAWRRSLVKLFRDWGDNKRSIDHDDLANRLAAQLAKMEARIEEALKSLEGGRSNDETDLNAYRLLGSYRGLSEAVVAHSRIVNNIDWPRWREARF